MQEFPGQDCISDQDRAFTRDSVSQNVNFSKYSSRHEKVIDRRAKSSSPTGTGSDSSSLPVVSLYSKRDSIIIRRLSSSGESSVHTDVESASSTTIDSLEVDPESSRGLDSLNAFDEEDRRKVKESSCNKQSALHNILWRRPDKRPCNQTGKHSRRDTSNSQGSRTQKRDKPNKKTSPPNCLDESFANINCI